MNVLEFERAASMTTPTSALHDDENEALYWLEMAKRILAGDIEPRQARTALNADVARRKASAFERRPLPTRH
ncbi:MAG: hypothetical protein WC670_04285 [Pseudolabrys sp.]